MANKYVDLSATSNGSGTIGSPWTWLQFYADISGSGGSVSAGDTILLKGKKDITLSPSGNKSLKLGDNNFQIILSAWDITQGPWRLYDSANRIALNGVIQIHGGVVISDYARSVSEKNQYAPNIMLYTSAITTSFIKAERVSLRSFPESSAAPLIVGGGYCYHNYCGITLRNTGISGTTIVSDSNEIRILDFDYREPTVLQIKDSVFYINSQNHQAGFCSYFRTPVSAVSAIWNWDVVPAASLSQLSGTARITSSSNMQYGWEVPISWPSWSADKQDFAYMFLGKGITISGSNNW